MALLHEVEASNVTHVVWEWRQGRLPVHFEKKMPGYLTKEAVLLGFETTTSSPIRMIRDDDTLMSPGFPGLYPCGEGAGWAGGIVSSALEGIRCAESALSALRAPL